MAGRNTPRAYAPSQKHWHVAAFINQKFFELRLLFVVNFISRPTNPEKLWVGFANLRGHVSIYGNAVGCLPERKRAPQIGI
jgi:hypothetical protein